jgi:hypothetical protein
MSNDFNKVLEGFWNSDIRLAKKVSEREFMTCDFRFIHKYIHVFKPNRFGFLLKENPIEVRDRLRELFDMSKKHSFDPKNLEVLGQITRKKDIPPEKRILMMKILEGLASRSDDAEIWKRAIYEMSVPLYTKNRGQREKLEEIAVRCLQNIQSIEIEEKRRACEECLYATGFFRPPETRAGIAFESICGAVFDCSEKTLRLIGREIKAADQPVVLAALTAFYLQNGGNGSSIFFQKLTDAAKNLPGGIPSITDIIVKGRFTNNEVYSQIVRGMSLILDCRQGPHPWFLPKPNDDGLFIPTFATYGIQRSAFDFCGRFPSPGSLLAVVDGVSKLVVPHIDGVGEGGPRGSFSVVKALPDISDSMRRNLLMAAIQPFEANVLTGLLFADPKPIPLNEVDYSKLIKFSIILERMVTTSGMLGRDDKALRVISSRALAKCLLEGTEGMEPIHAAWTVEKNLELALNLGANALGFPRNEMPNVERVLYAAKLFGEKDATPKCRSKRTPKQLNPKRKTNK